MIVAFLGSVKSRSSLLVFRSSSQIVILTSGFAYLSDFLLEQESLTCFDILLRPHLQFIYSVQESQPVVHRLRILCLDLGPDLPWGDEPSPGILRLSTGKILTYLSLLMPAFSLV